VSALPSDAERFVATADIRAFIRGRETNIPDTLGIRWRDGRPHMRCPYPDKNPSWCWDERERRAVCTCGSRSILDVLGKVEGITSLRRIFGSDVLR
jgi:hypothetical protein